ncbi:MAG TPA: DUF4149 domain-containing protein [Ramlibacter sp.]|uniref:DUF4149 domain-containing protein n=1 Tax=Ramlibacter sp. TaxID=1917967 RepID=UPI002D7E2D84|nr:DUF4149 domain-containing protein [Ramlibacter sp.]HET8745058.1 DUF4149 domain-containing protein [Ramlibacter sp.]
MHWKARLTLFAAALWWGSLSVIGFMAVPLLFRNASSARVAGQLAGKLFEAQTWLGLVCGIVVLMGARDEDGTATLGWARGAVGFVLAGMLCALLQQFAVAPHIVARENLPFWHGFGTVLYGVQWVCAGVLLWKVSGDFQPAALTPPGSSSPTSASASPSSPSRRA